MIPCRRVYLDTNIFIFAVEGSDGISERISEILVRAENRPDFLFTSEISIAELLVKPLRLQDAGLIREFDNLLFGGRGIDVVTLQPMAYRYAAALRSHRPSIKLPDALHIAAAIAGDASHFLTLDVGIGPPFEVSNLRIIDDPPQPDLTIIRPDIPTLDTLLQSLET